PRWSSRPQRELNQSAFRTGLMLSGSALLSLMASSCRSFDDRRAGAGGRRLLRLRAAALTALGGLHREANRQDQHRTIEQRLDKERCAELVEAGDGHRQHG